MNFLRNVLRSTERRIIQPVSISQQQKRTTIIVRRTKELGLVKEGALPKIRNRNKIYEVVVNKNLEKSAPIKVILTDYVEGIGDTGDVVDVKARTVRGKLFPQNLAIYASPENLEELEREKAARGEEDQPKMSPFTLKTVRMLGGMNLLVPMNAEIPWTIDKSHIRIAFRKMGVEVPEEAITLPEEPVTEPTDFTIQVIVNNAEKVDVNAVIQPIYKDAEKNAQFKRPKILQKSRKTEGTIET